MTYNKEVIFVDELLVWWGQAIRNHRLNRDLTQAMLAKEAGVSLRTLIRMEDGRSVQSNNLIKVVGALGLKENLLQLVPDVAVSPLALVKNAGKKRKRVRFKNKDKSAEAEWSWGDDE